MHAGKGSMTCLVSSKWVMRCRLVGWISEEMYAVRCSMEGTKGLVGKILTQGLGLTQKEWGLPASLHLPCSQQFGGVPVGLDETEKSSLTE